MVTTGSRFFHKQNRLKQLRAFCSTAQNGSVSRAAEQMFLSQPSISLLIKALEKDLGKSLFNRRGPRIHLTGEGKILLELALPLVEGLETLPEFFSEKCSNQITGELNIAAGESTILYILPDIIKKFKTDYPHIKLKLSNVTSRDGLTMLRDGQADFAVGSLLDIPEDIIYIPTLTYDPVLITPVNHPLTCKKTLTLSDIGQYGLILPPSHLTTWRVVNMIFQQHGVNYAVALEAGGWEVIKKYVTMGLGISIVTSICLSGDEKLVVIELNKYFPKRSYGLIVRRGKFLSPAARHFFDMMHQDALEQFNIQNEKALHEGGINNA